MKQKLIVIAGPTGIGKSDLAIDIISQLKFGEIVGADSMQIYQALDIGTGKTPVEQRRDVAHHMIDVVNPDESYSVGQYAKSAKDIISRIAHGGTLPFLVGGTGLYISALLSGHTFSSTTRDEKLREQLNQHDSAYLHTELEKIDAVSARAISPNDKKRIIRALEIFYVSGKPKSEQADFCAQSDYDYLLFVLTADRELLYKKIESRVDKMLDLGLVDEVRRLRSSCTDEAQSMQAIGYKELIAYIDGKCTLDEAVAQLKMNSRRYAKRQITYFKNMPFSKEFVDMSEPLIAQKLCAKITEFVKK